MLLLIIKVLKWCFCCRFAVGVSTFAVVFVVGVGIAVIAGVVANYGCEIVCHK